MGMFLGLANGDIPRDPTGFSADLVNGWAERGIRCLAFGFPSIPQSATAEAAKELRPLLDDHGIHVSQYVGVNANLASIDPAARAEGLERIRAAIPAAQALDTTMIQSGAGTNSPTATSHYSPHPDNYSDRAREGLIEALSTIAPEIADAGLLYSLECHLLTTMRSVEVIREVLDAVDSDVIVANFDPVNMLDSPTAVYDNAARMAHMVDVMVPTDGPSRYGPTSHIKDVVLHDKLVSHIDEVAPGKGVLDLDAFFAAATKLPTGRRNGTALIVEHLGPDASYEGIDLVREAAIARGVELL
ncbi:sugar phosphate isomerase/epimerase family protein [Propionibacteriaceae bacterium Y2011]|uniref:sugar phosphate isomerase/epimerase family protein n=1 Tax=Microlunatus sp. Y2014 TaxID=3418488 RepID=UPI003B4F12D2